MKLAHIPHLVVIGLHPSIDHTIEIQRFQPKPVIPGRLLLVEPTGKGINVAHTLSNLGCHITVSGFLGCKERDLFLSSFRKARVTTDFVYVNCATRQNITLIERQTRKDTHIKVGNMHVTRRDIDILLKKIRQCVRAENWAVLSGSYPKGMQPSDYANLLQLCRQAGARICVDASGQALRAALKEKPWLIKPNVVELQELIGRRLRTIRGQLRAARQLLEQCDNVLVSLGPKGAMLITTERAWHAFERSPTKVVHTVGCGDALLAGFVAACAKGKKPDIALRFAVACGSACARSSYACIRSPREPGRYLPKICLETI